MNVWVQTRGGQLINLSFVERVEVAASEGGAVQAVVHLASGKTATLTLRDGAALAELQAHLGSIIGNNQGELTDIGAFEA